MKHYRILWAINPLDEDQRVFDRAVEMIKAINKKTEVQVMPVYVLNPEVVRWAGEIPLQELKKFTGEVSLQIEKRTKKLGKIHCSLPVVLHNTDLSTTKSVKKILKYAKTHAIDAILSVSHAKSEFSNMLLGSFSETLLMQSKLPVIMVPNTSEKIKGLNNLVFPVDLANQDTKAINEITKFSKKINAKLTLVHKMPNSVDPMLQSGSYMLGGGWISVGEFFQADMNQRKEALKKLKASLSKKIEKVNTKLLDGEGSIAGEVHEYVNKKNIPMIAVTTSSTNRAGFILGSVARSIIKESNKPVIVLHK